MDSFLYKGKQSGKATYEVFDGEGRHTATVDQREIGGRDFQLDIGLLLFLSLNF
ncbi:MAG: hypothetical protein GY859_17180 [Desulfobacterales bacterium]|nr:hypothetical protein [Desulfobacterales bacterium]